MPEEEAVRVTVNIPKKYYSYFEFLGTLTKRPPEELVESYLKTRLLNIFGRKSSVLEKLEARADCFGTLDCACPSACDISTSCRVKFLGNADIYPYGF